ncbi:MAG: hypothetical protein V1882_02705 [Candidatus Omnitrophota bacterium]
MPRTLKWMMVGLVAGTFFLEAPPAYAIFGIRVARKAIAARRAEKAMTSPENSTEQAPAFQSANPNLEKLERSEPESRNS